MIHYESLLENVIDIITKCSRCFITKCDRSLLQNASGFLLQNATVITKCDVYPKLRQYNNVSDAVFLLRARESPDSKTDSINKSLKALSSGHMIVKSLK